MAGSCIEVKTECVANLKGLLKFAKDFKPALKTCGLYMYKSVVRTFGSGGHGMWKPLSPATIARRRKHSNMPLQDTGRLRRSVTGMGGDSVYELTNTYLVIGTNVEYAAVHQYGHTFVRVPRAGSAVLKWKKKKSNGKQGWVFSSKKWQKNNPASGKYKPAKSVVKIQVTKLNKAGKTVKVWKNATKDMLDANGHLKPGAHSGASKVVHTPGHTVKVKQLHVKWASGFHTDHTSIYYQTVPARPFLVIWDEDEKALCGIIERYAIKSWNEGDV